MSGSRLKVLGEQNGVSCSSAAQASAATSEIPSVMAESGFAGNVLMVTLGCAKNLVDSEIMLGALSLRGFRPIDDPEQADLIVVNTCGFLQSAVEEGIERILELGEYKERGRCRKLVVSGCMVERYRDKLEHELPEVDQFLTTDELLEAGAESKPGLVFDAARRPYFLYDESMPRLRSTAGYFAYVKIAEGCDRPCAFCIIPKLRGAFRSRAIDSVVAEVCGMADEGIVEFNFIAQDLTAYGSDFPGNRGIKSELPALLRRLEQELSSYQQRLWLRLFYAYPVGVNEELLRAITESNRVCPYLDLPLQHISNSVLKGMQRPLGEKGTRRLIEQISKDFPEIALRTTFVTGFPGETDQDLRRLQEFVAEGHFCHVGVFPYSQEEEAKSFTFENQVPEELREQRRDRIMEAQQAVVTKRLEAKIGSREIVLVEGTHEDSDLLLSGRAIWQGPEADGCVIINDVAENLQDAEGDLSIEVVGRFAEVEITEVAGYDLVGRLLQLA